MRAGLSTIQQTLTPEAAAVLNQSIAEAGRRNHGQTTPLHVAATLLASQSGYLRHACIRSHPNSSHPLQCRALDLCFSVALERLPSAQNVSPSPPLEPPISNALMAALKRAQAHQRRGCPEQQQQPLLAVKVELEQLVVSILDDPSVSRVMREASFSSPAVKATIEQALNSSTNSTNSISCSSSPIGITGFRPAVAAAPASRNLYMSPRLQQQQQQGSQESHQQTGQVQRRDDVKRVVEILLRSKKRNPVLVGETEPVLLLRELLQKIEKREIGEGVLKNVRVICLEKELGIDKTAQMVSKIKDLGDLIENQIKGYTGVVVDLGDLKWLVEQPQGVVGEAARAGVAEMGKVLARFGEGRGRVWLIGTATCETYLRCQVYHPSMEGEWDLQAVPIAARASPFQGLFPRIGGNNGILSTSVESLSPLKGFPATATALSARRPSENSDPARRTKCCPLCTQSYERELAKMAAANELENSSLDTKAEGAKQPLPQWLQSAKLNSNGSVNKTADQVQTKDKEAIRKQKTEELEKKWNDTCSRMHPSFHRNAISEIITPAALSMTSMYNPSNALSRQTFEPKLQLNRTLGGTLQPSRSSPLRNPSPEPRTSPLGSPVRTELVLGCTKSPENSPEGERKEKLMNKNLCGCITLESIERANELQKEKVAGALDPDSFKTLFKGLLEKVWWQKEAASAVAATVIQCRSGNSKRKCFGWKSDTWMLFAGPDRVGKKKMAMALAELLCRSSPVTIRLGSRSKDVNTEESEFNFRGKTTLDRIVEAVQRNPSAVVMLEDIDQADMVVHGSIKRAMERGRLVDSHGREVSTKNVIFILTSTWLPENRKDSSEEWLPCDEEKLANLASREWQLQLSIVAKPRKRRLDWLHNDIRPTKSRTDAAGLSFDLNETAAGNEEDENAEGSRNSSDLTVEHDQENALMNKRLHSPSTSPMVPELFRSVDDAIVFKPVDFGALRTRVSGAISSMFSTVVDGKRSIEVDKEALERIVGGIWFGQAELEEWIEKVLVSSFKNLKSSLITSSSGGGIEDDPTVVRLVSVGDSGRKSSWDWLPRKVTVNTQGS